MKGLGADGIGDPLKPARVDRGSGVEGDLRLAPEARQVLVPAIAGLGRRIDPVAGTSIELGGRELPDDQRVRGHVGRVADRMPNRERSRPTGCAGSIQKPAVSDPWRRILHQSGIGVLPALPGS